MTPDPVTREIVKNALAAAADEMAIALYRTAYSTIVRDCLDYSTSLCDGQGEMIAQGVTIPLHLGSVPFAMETLLAKYGESMEEGDIFILNDPFEGGMHIPDIFIIKPIYWEGSRVAFSVATAHHLDLGGRLPGSSACDNTEIFQEGLRIPWLKLYRRGEPDESLFAMLRVNVRVPEMTLGDVRAQVAACHTGERAVRELVRRYGPDTFRACAADLIDYTERLMRAEIARWPDGTRTFTDYMDSDGMGGPPVKLHVAVTVRGDSLTADFTGTAAQAPGAINNTFSFTFSVAALTVRAALRQELPNTAGIFRPITVIAPEGTVLNVVMPGASSMRGITGFRLADLMFGALAQFVPHRIQAAGEGGNSLVVIGGRRPDRSPYVYYELMTGTWGARPDRDGNDGLCNPANVASNIPVEEAESNYPVRIERYGLVRDSGGPGRFRGGMAVEREWRLLDGRAHLAIRSDRRDHLPYGLAGGRPGRGSTNVLRRASGQEETLITMISTSMEAGERLYHRQAAGGGWGDPLQRDPELVARDVRNDKVSLRSAREDYGVVLDPDTFAVDREATLRRRRRPASGTVAREVEERERREESRVSDVPTYVLQRAFDAPRELVWKAWTDAELLPRWYGPGVETIVHRLDVRPGGLWLGEMRMGGGSHYQRVEYTEVTPPERLVWLHSVTDADWNVTANPMMPGWPRVLLTTVTFREDGGRTRVRLTWVPHEASDAEVAAFAGAIDSLDKGWSAGMDLIVELLAELQG